MEHDAIERALQAIAWRLDGIARELRAMREAQKPPIPNPEFSRTWLRPSEPGTPERRR